MTAQLSLFKGRRQRGIQPPLAKEFATHVALADAMRRGCVSGWIWTHFPAGEARTEATGRRLKRMGLKPGFADFLLIDPDGVHYWLELKRGKAPLTVAQNEFGVEMIERGVPYACCRSFNEAIATLRVWGAIRMTVTA